MFDVEIDDLRVSGRAATDVADAVERLEPSAAVRQAGEGLPGAASGAQLSLLATQWDEELAAVVTGARAHGGKLSASADLYETTEAAAEAAFPAPTPRGAR